ncbi:unnamed protein product [Colletotrichum noveboracense]|uniref:Uncharacterized protein n=1 Tax=Colletotrichum noveboracense TaxID=2664923 RepID=A0A9W4RK63_9PEZI|nr:hypothetical protein K456DRAFT_749039 [Colletotrichum gloeosporioides 23]CAI0643988.1 unnamed protein product [Colletotrichum noveboracense]
MCHGTNKYIICPCINRECPQRQGCELSNIVLQSNEIGHVTDVKPQAQWEDKERCGRWWLEQPAEISTNPRVSPEGRCPDFEETQVKRMGYMCHQCLQEKQVQCGHARYDDPRVAIPYALYPAERRPQPGHRQPEPQVSVNLPDAAPQRFPQPESYDRQIRRKYPLRTFGAPSLFSIQPQKEWAGLSIFDFSATRLGSGQSYEDEKTEFYHTLPMALCEDMDIDPMIYEMTDSHPFPPPNARANRGRRRDFVNGSTNFGAIGDGRLLPGSSPATNGGRNPYGAIGDAFPHPDSSADNSYNSSNSTGN